MKIRELALSVAVGGLVLTGCGGGETVETDAVATPQDAMEAVQQQAEKAKDVEIEDRKTLSKSARIANSYLQGMDEIVTALESVNDAESAEAAAEVMAKVGETFDALYEEVEGGGRERAIGMIMTSRQQEFLAVQQRMMGAVMRIQTQNPELMKTVSEGMRKADLQ